MPRGALKKGANATFDKSFSILKDAISNQGYFAKYKLITSILILEILSVKKRYSTKIHT